jgi:hypothetical protein
LAQSVGQEGRAAFSSLALAVFQTLLLLPFPVALMATTHTKRLRTRNGATKKKRKNSSQPVINPFPLPFFPGSGLEETNKIKKRKKTTITTLLPRDQNTQSDDPHRLDPLLSYFFSRAPRGYYADVFIFDGHPLTLT